MKKINLSQGIGFNSLPVLITEKAMRRATENHINTHTANRSGWRYTGDYIDENGFNGHARQSKIYVNLEWEPNMILIQRSCDYQPDYLYERTT